MEDQSDKNKKSCCSFEKSTSHCGNKACCISTPLSVAGVIFGLVALVHLYHIINPFPINIGTVAVPHTASYVAFVVFGLLSFWMFSSACKAKKL